MEMSLNIFSNLKDNHIIDDAKALIKKVYLDDNRPWVVGYSGGKDSTVVAQLVFESLSELPKENLHKKVYIISSDTMVETPLIIQSIDKTLHRMQAAAFAQNLPIETHKVKPIIENTFWSLMIGRGYPAPNQKFRWCTDRLKIDPANHFIMDKVDSFGEVIMVLGVRENESQTRDHVIKSYTIEGKELMRHSTLPNAYVFAPIKTLSLDDVWDYLLNNTSPWGDNNFDLHKLYQDSTGECPLVIDKNIKETAGSCGNSRFGCWTCTVVAEDKALNGFIKSGSSWMRPLLEYRNYLADIRDDRSKRMKYRMNGQVYFTEVNIVEIENIKQVIIPKKSRKGKEEIPLSNYTILEKNTLKEFIIENEIDLSSSDDPMILINLGNERYGRLGVGPYTMEARKEMLAKLLEVQKNLKNSHDKKFELITEEELRVIRRYWLTDGDWEDTLPKIYKEIIGCDLDWEINDRPLFTQDQIFDLEQLCHEFDVDLNMIKKLISLQKDFSGYKIRRGLMNEIEKILKQEYLHIS